MIVAYAKGNQIVNHLDILSQSDIIFCSTGSLSLSGDDFKYLKNGCFVASVTSSDDEMDLQWLKRNYAVNRLDDFIEEYSLNGRSIYLINEGNAVNFIHGAVVDDFILLVQKEIIDSIIEMKDFQNTYEIVESTKTAKIRIADSWLKNIIKINI